MTLYFKLLKYLMITMLICFAFAFFCLVDNYFADKEEEWEASLKDHMIISGTIAAHGTGTPSVIQPWLFAAMGWAILIYYIFITYRTNCLKKEIDDDEKSPADYTLMISNLPRHVTEDEIKSWIQI